MKSTTSYTYKDIWLIAYPILISLIMEQMIGITDTAFLGHVGEIELGASAIAGVYYLAIFMIGFGFTVGSQILIARRNGEGNYRAIGNIYHQEIDTLIEDESGYFYPFTSFFRTNTGNVSQFGPYSRCSN